MLFKKSKNPDFEGVNELVGISIIFLVGIYISIINLFTEPWNISRLVIVKGARFYLSPIEEFFIVFSLMLLFLVPALYTAWKKCLLRVKNNEITQDAGKKEYIRFIVEYIIKSIIYFIIVIVVCIFLKILIL